jgi:phosphate starvation-inducible PhoH-like protein
MAEATIHLGSHAEELAVLGSRDQNLKLIRDALGVKILARHGVLRIEGDEAQVEQASNVIDSLRHAHRSQRVMSADEVADLIDTLHVVPDDGGDVGAALRLGSKLVRPKSDGQARYVQALQQNELVLCSGPAGTGKTYLAVAAAVAALRQGRIKKIVLVRPAVEAGEHLGFLPGDMEAKINPYLRPLLDALHDLMDFGQIRRYMGGDLIEIAPLAYMRGRTLNDAVIILDEGQNTTIPQMKMFLTRMGTNARIVVTGDTTQVDLPPNVPSGLADAVSRLKGIPGIALIRLSATDTVRHPLVQSIVQAYERPDEGTAPAAGADLPSTESGR